MIGRLALDYHRGAVSRVSGDPQFTVFPLNFLKIELAEYLCSLDFRRVYGQLGRAFFTRGIMVCRYSEMVGIRTNDDFVCV